MWIEIKIENSGFIDYLYFFIETIEKMKILLSGFPGCDYRYIHKDSYEWNTRKNREVKLQAKTIL